MIPPKLQKWEVAVLREFSSRKTTWTVIACSKDDAIMIAFALDGGWSPNEKDASGMLALAKSYCSAEKVATLARQATNPEKSLVASNGPTENLIRKWRWQLHDACGEIETLPSSSQQTKAVSAVSNVAFDMQAFLTERNLYLGKPIT